MIGLPDKKSGKAVVAIHAAIVVLMNSLLPILFVLPNFDGLFKTRRFAAVLGSLESLHKTEAGVQTASFPSRQIRLRNCHS